MKVLVTGANGLLATHTVQKLLENGYTVKGLLRDPGKIQLPSQEGLEIVQGDITNKQAVTRAVKGCNYVVHAAAITAPDILDYKTYHEVNVTGTENILMAVQAQGIKKFVYISSANTIGYGSANNPGTETKPMKAPFSRSWYAQSKYQAQQKVLAVPGSIMKVVVVNPTFMIGSWDAKPSSGRIVQMGINKPLVFYPPGGKNFVNATDVANGVVTALQRGVHGETYLLAGENLSYKQFFEKLKPYGSRNILVPIPGFLLLAAGYMGDLLRFFKVQATLTVVNARILCTKNYYSNQKAREELGCNFHPIEKGIEEAVMWFQKKGKK